jgi:hypothetical protein
MTSSSATNAVTGSDLLTGLISFVACIQRAPGHPTPYLD